MNHWRFLDTGQRSAAENMALDSALLNTKKIQNIPNTIRFLQFKPPAVLLGYHQSMEQEIRVNFCKKFNIDINRRITGGGAIYFDTTQLGWEIICDKEFFGMQVADPHFFNKLSQPLISMLEELGLHASFRPRNDIEIDGKKISGTGGTEEEDVFLFQGTLLTDFDIVSMIKALRIPIAKLKDKNINEAKDRITCLKWELTTLPSINELKFLLKKHFEKVWNIHLEPGRLTLLEEKYSKKYLQKFQSKKWINKIKYPKQEQQIVHSIIKTDGGIIRTSLMINKRLNRIQSVLITGDFFAYPKRIISDLEAELRDIPINNSLIRIKIITFMEKYKPRIPGINSEDFIKGIDKALEKSQLTDFGIPLSSANRVYTVNNTFNEIIKKYPNYLLLPYCSKSINCGYRYKKECLVCGNCSIGDAIQLAEEQHMSIKTILSFEDLMQTLNQFKKDGITSYIGCCCEAFFTKHIEDFEKSTIPAILVDINNTTCYDLGKEKEAYIGKFESQTDIDLDLLKMIINARNI